LAGKERITTDIVRFSTLKAFARCLYERRTRLTKELAILIVPFAVAFAWGGRNLLGYVRWAVGANWGDGLTILERAALYLPGGSMPWGPLPLLFVVALFWCISICNARKEWSAIIFVVSGLTVSAMFVVPLVAAKTSNPSFGSYFMGGILGTTLIAVRHVSAHSIIGRRILLAATVLCLAAVRVGEGPTGREDDLRLARVSYERIVDQIVELKTRANPSVRLVFEDADAGYPNLSLIHYAKTGKVLDAGRIDDFSNADKFSKATRAADFVVTLQPDSPDIGAGYSIQSRFPSSRDLVGGDRAVSSQPFLVKVGSFPWKNGQLNLYRNSFP
jgi:hypothetical protein